MADYDTLTLVGRHVPDAGSGPFSSFDEANAAGYDVLTPVTGMYEIGALIDGQFVPIISEKASLIFDRVAAAKQAQAEAEAAQPQQPAAPPAAAAPAEQPAEQPETGPLAEQPAAPSEPQA